jgi:Uncharacterized conserved protein (DUF2278)
VALDHYGVLVGTLHRHFRDQPDTQGRWYHVNLELDAPAGRYRCAVDVDSKQSAVGVQWKVLTISPGVLEVVPDLEPGYHELARLHSAGALDHIRHPALADSGGYSWISGSNLEAAAALEPTLAIDRRTLVFGEPFTTGLGMHNIHQNQGDPAGSQWWAENAIWQDGGVMTEGPDGSLQAFVSKFSTQASSTDDDGHPI